MGDRRQSSKRCTTCRVRALPRSGPRWRGAGWRAGLRPAVAQDQAPWTTPRPRGRTAPAPGAGVAQSGVDCRRPELSETTP
eukprot:9099488-Pyramimonas_sp.AAC.1